MAALSAKLSVAVSAPADLGLKTTETVQVALTAREAAQVVVLEKEEAFAPLRVMPVRLRVAVPVFVSETVCAAEVAPSLVLAKERLVGERLAAGAAVVAAAQAVMNWETSSEPRPVIRS